eukprot:TRINITY_DN4742_c0_g1_i2.p4 TRINITY_DN4742_c0_g1~~TRINITY_DN4742_c0_g1_i2.p4  ORF type:complete len:100 (-),score=12.29 TRINITY_DN4742_c0_g1_i2:35-334(-)
MDECVGEARSSMKAVPALLSLPSFVLVHSLPSFVLVHSLPSFVLVLSLPSFVPVLSCPLQCSVLALLCLLHCFVGARRPHLRPSFAKHVRLFLRRWFSI